MPLAQSDILAIQKLLSANQASSAEPLARAAAKNEPNDANAWFLLASVMRALNQSEDAMAALQRALLIQPFHPGYHTFQAELHLDAGRTVAAEEALNRALSAKADFVPALSLLGVLYMDSGRAADAVRPLQQCARLEPNSAQHANNLGAALLAAGREQEAEAAFAAAVRIDPNYFTARYNLVRAQVKRGADREASIQLQVLLNQQPAHQECLFLVGNICHRNGDFKTAEEYLRRAAQIQPHNPAIINAYAEFCWEQGDTKTAIGLYEVSAATEPANIRAALGRHLSLPMVAESKQALDAARTRFAEGLKRLRGELPIHTARPRGHLLREIQWTNFLLAYQGEDDLALQREYAEWVGDLLKKALPQHADPRPPRKPGKARIGFISDHLYDCTAGRYFESWVTGLPAGKYDVHVYNGSTSRDTLTARVLAGASTVREIYALDLERLAALISEDDLDVLIYPEMGMHPQLFPLGALRLARVQVAGWGHPVTTGMGEMDYFLSCADMEPANGASHYGEKLQLLPGLGTCYKAPSADGKVANRADYGLPATGALYLVPQSLYKIHPDNDKILTELLKLDPAGTLIMFASDRHRVATTQFIQRLQHAMRMAGVEPEGRARIIPQVDHEQYLAINRMCDVMVDTVRWSGGNTTLDALAVGLPVVTTEGLYMRGRQSAAMLRMAGVSDLIVDSPDLLAAAVSDLANNPEKLASARKRIADGRRHLFDQSAPLRALDEFLESVSR